MAPPSKIIDLEKVTNMRRTNTDWVAIAKELGVSVKLIQTWKKKVNFVEPLKTLSEEDLDWFIQENTKEGRGEVCMMQLLIASGFVATRQNLRESIHRMDRDGIDERKCSWLKNGSEYNPVITTAVVLPVTPPVSYPTPPPPQLLLPLAPPYPIPTCPSPTYRLVPGIIHPNGRVSRRFDLERITDMRRSNTDWVDIGKELGLSVKTLQNWKKKVNFVEPLRTLTELELDDFIQQNAQAERGEVCMMQLLIASGCFTTRSKLRESINRVDGEAKRERKRKLSQFFGDEKDSQATFNTTSSADYNYFVDVID